MVFAPLEAVAACESDRPPYRHRLCPYAQGFVGRAFSRRGEDRAGAGQSQHPQARLALRSLSRPRGAPARRAFRMALHAQGSPHFLRKRGNKRIVEAEEEPETSIRWK